MASGWRGAVRRHEHSLAVGWLALVALLAAAVAFQPTRLAALQAVERGVRWWDDRWERRVEQGAGLLAAGKTEDAVRYLERLDRIHPATNTRHARDNERARLLRLLGRSYEATGRRGRAMATYQRLVAFDSLNYYSSFVLGMAAERLESGWAVAPEARDAFAAVLRIHPVHLPSVRGVVAYYMDRGEFGPVRDAFQSYVDAHLVQVVSIRIGDGLLSLPVLVDGRARDYELSLPNPSVGAARVEVQAGGFPFAVERVELIAGPAVGVPGIAPPLGLAVAPRTAGPDGLLAAATAAAPGQTRPSTVRIRLAVFKPVDAALWTNVTKGFRNLLEDGHLAELARRVTVFPTVAEADGIVGRQGWASESLGLGADEQLY